jgi:hypothetical protein
MAIHVHEDECESEQSEEVEKDTSTGTICSQAQWQVKNVCRRILLKYNVLNLPLGYIGVTRYQNVYEPSAEPGIPCKSCSRILNLRREF